MTKYRSRVPCLLAVMISGLGGQTRVSVGRLSSPASEITSQSAFALVGRADIVAVGRAESFRVVQFTAEKESLEAERARSEEETTPDRRPLVVARRYGTVQSVRLSAVQFQRADRGRFPGQINLFTAWVSGKANFAAIRTSGEEEYLLILKRLDTKALAAEYGVDPDQTYYESVEGYSVVSKPNSRALPKATKADPAAALFERVTRFCSALNTDPLGQRLFRLEQLRLESDPILAEDARQELDKQRGLRQQDR